MTRFAERQLPERADDIAPDGSEVRILLRLDGGSTAHFVLAAGQVSRAALHRTVEEIWFVISGTGEIWRRQDGSESVVALEPGLCLTIPLGTAFQFRAAPGERLAIIGVTMPPWPGDGEAEIVAGRWRPTV